MKARLGVLICLVAAMLAAGFAQEAAPAPATPTREQVQKLLAAIGVEHHLEAMLQERQSKVREGARGCFRDMNPGADAATLKSLDAAFDKTPAVTPADISEGLIAELQKDLSAAEVQAGIEFYGSPEGRSLAQKLPRILQTMRVDIGPTVEQKLQAYTNSLNRTLMDFQQEMNRRKPAAPRPGAVETSPGGAHTGTI